MDTFIARVQRIQKDIQTLSNELETVLHEYTTQQPQVILPARKPGRPKKADVAAREAAKEIQKAEAAAATLAKTPKKGLKKLKSTSEPQPRPQPQPEVKVQICRSCGFDLTLGEDHRRCFFGGNYTTEKEWLEDCTAYAKEIGAGVAYAAS